MKPRLFFERIIYRDKKAIGSIMLVNYSNKPMSHIESQLDKEYQGRGIIARELPKYLKSCKKAGYQKIMAVVKKDNSPSYRLLEKNNFVKLQELDETFCYIAHLGLDVGIMKETLLAFNKN